MFSLHLQIILIIAVIGYFLIILKLLKDKALSLKYTLLWLLAGVVMGVLVIFPKTLFYLCKLSGIQTPMYALLTMCIAFVLMILMSLTSIVSRQNRKIRTLIQDYALLEKRVRDLELNSKESKNPNH